MGRPAPGKKKSGFSRSPLVLYCVDKSLESDFPFSFFVVDYLVTYDKITPRKESFQLVKLSVFFHLFAVGYTDRL